jgi:hypothetical protein
MRLMQYLSFWAGASASAYAAQWGLWGRSKQSWPLEAFEPGPLRRVGATVTAAKLQRRRKLAAAPGPASGRGPVCSGTLQCLHVRSDRWPGQVRYVTRPESAAMRGLHKKRSVRASSNCHLVAIAGRTRLCKRKSRVRLTGWRSRVPTQASASPRRSSEAHRAATW